MPELDTERGIGLAAKQTYEGEPEGLAAYVEEQYGYEFDGHPHPMCAAIQDQTARLDQIGMTAGSTAPPSQNEVLAEAERTRDNTTTMRIKGQQVADMFRP